MACSTACRVNTVTMSYRYCAEARTSDMQSHSSDAARAASAITWLSGCLPFSISSAFRALIGVGATAPRPIFMSVQTLVPGSIVMTAATPTIARSTLPRNECFKYVVPVWGGKAGTCISASNSPVFRAVFPGPVKNFSMGTSRPEVDPRS